MYKLLFFTLLSFLSPSLDEAILFLSGASALEELSDQELERYNNYNETPLQINFVAKSRLISSGLFTNFQVVSLLDYRSKTGDILSPQELALIDGFNEEKAAALSHFLSFTGSLTSERKRQYNHKLTLNYKASENQALKLRYEAQIGNNFVAYWTTKTDFKTTPHPGTISAAYYGKKYLSKLIVGSFVSKFGQGLCAWSAFQLSGYSSVGAFTKNPSGFVPTASISSKDWGVCSEIALGNFALSLGYSINSKELTSNLSYNTKTLSLGATATLHQASIDWKIARPDLSIFGEISSTYKGEIAALTGLYYSPSYGEKYALQLRYFDAKFKSYSGIAIGSETKLLTATIDCGYRSDKGIFQVKPLLILKNPYAELRYSLKYRNGEKMRNDLRLDLTFSLGKWTSKARINPLYCNDFAILYYLQIGRKTDKLSIYARATFYNIKSWEDRIYVYQQEAPGGFNVPAFYGRGVSYYIYSVLNLNSQHSIYLRCEFRKNFEFQLQYRWKL